MSRRPVQQRAEAVRLLAAGASSSEVAARLGVPPRTVRRWTEGLLVADVTAAESQPRARPASAVAAAAGSLDDDPDSAEPASLVWPAPPLVRPGVALPAPDDHDGREALVAAAIGAGWSDSVRMQLAAVLGGSDATDGYRSRVLARRARRLDESSETQLAEQLMLVEYSYATAMRHRDIAGATRLLAQRGRLLGQDRLQVQVEHSGRLEHGLSPEELLERRRGVLERVRELDS